jgi:nicotinamidase-related amidase
MLREECDPDYELYYVPRAHKCIANTKKLLHAFRMLGREVIHTRHGPISRGRVRH